MLLLTPPPPPAPLHGSIATRPAGPDDRAFERSLFEAARLDAAHLAPWPEEARRTFLDQQFRFQTLHYGRIYPNAQRLIVTAHAMPIGRMILETSTDPWRLVDIALVPERRGRGIGAMLLNDVLAAAARAPATVTLTVDMGNPARRLYRRLGFRVTEESTPNLVMAWRPDDQLKTA